MAVHFRHANIIDYAIGVYSAIAELAVVYDDTANGANLYLRAYGSLAVESDIGGGLRAVANYSDGVRQIMEDAVDPVDIDATVGGQWYRLDADALVAVSDAPTASTAFVMAEMLRVETGKTLVSIDLEYAEP